MADSGNHMGGGNGGDPTGNQPGLETAAPELAIALEETITAETTVGGGGDGEAEAGLEAGQEVDRLAPESSRRAPVVPQPEASPEVVATVGGSSSVGIGAAEHNGSVAGSTNIEAATAIGDGSDRLAPVREGRAPVVEETGEMGGGSRIEAAMESADSRAPGSERRAPVVVEAEASGGPGPFEVHGGPIEGDDDGGMEAILEEIEWDPSRGKQPMDIDSSRQQGAEEARPDLGVVAFIPPTGSSSQQPVYQADFAEFICEEQLPELGRTNPSLVGTMLQMRQEHVEGQVRRAEEIRLVMEREASTRR